MPYRKYRVINWENAIYWREKRKFDELLSDVVSQLRYLSHITRLSCLSSMSTKVTQLILNVK